MRLPDPERSAALLISSGELANSTTAELGDALRGVVGEHVVVAGLGNFSFPSNATDLLLVYYANPKDMLLQQIRAVMMATPAAHRVLILDGDPGSHVLWEALTEISVITTPVMPGHDFLFAEMLSDVLRHGIAGGPELLTFRALHHEVHHQLMARGLPGPQARFAESIGEIGLAPNRAYRVPSTWVPGFAGETTRGQDLLGVRADATALAVLLSSASLTPPLSIGVYGEWGSGKSFLMRTLDDEVQRLSRSAAQQFCHNVASVWFNAWHYAEGNLWASLIHHIFLSLHGSGAAPQQVLDDALATVQGVQEAKSDAAAHADAAQRDAGRAREALAELAATHEQARAKAAQVTARDVWATISINSDLRADLDHSLAALGLPEVGNDVREITQAVGEVRSTVRRGWALAIAKPWWTSPLVLGLIVAVGGLAVGAFVDRAQAWLVPLLGLIGGAATWLSRQGSLFRQLLRPAERIQRQLDARLAEIDARQEVARQRLADTQAEVIAARQRLVEAQARADAAQAELDQLTGARLLERYLSERVGSGDYGRYLGVVARAHRDLRDLDAYLREAATIDRIVLYIDDLDRCPPDTVVKVLEAVHLLLALPLFVVVVGVDVRWLTSSLRHRHPLLLDHDGPSAEPADYLDKIFQLTYRLPTMTQETTADLLRHTALSGQPADEQPVMAITGSLPTPEQPASRPAEPSTEAPESVTERIRFGIDALRMDDDELDTLRLVAPLLGSSPRRAKRFLNTYRVSKARAIGDPELRNHLDTHALLVLTALAVGLNEPITPEPDDATLGDWLKRDERLAEFSSGAGPLLNLPMSDVLRWLPVVQRFAWPVR